MASPPESESGSYSDDEGASHFDIRTLSTSTSIPVGERLSSDILQDPSPTDSGSGNWHDDLPNFKGDDRFSRTFSGAFSPPDTGNALKRDGDQRGGRSQLVRYFDKESLRKEILEEQMTPPLSLMSSGSVPTRPSTSATNHSFASRPATSLTNQSFSKPLNTSSTTNTLATIPEPEDSLSAPTNDIFLEVMVKLDLLPCIVALQASTRPNAGPEEAHRALNLASEAHANALRRGADGALLGKCLYYVGVASFALGNVEDESTIKPLELAARLAPEESASARRWLKFVREQKRAREAKRSEMSRREMSLLSWAPFQALGGLFPGSWSSRAVRAEPPGAGLYAQIAHARNRTPPKKPAKKQHIAVSTSSGGSSRVIPMAIPATKRMVLSTRSGGSQASHDRGQPYSAEDPNTSQSSTRVLSKDLVTSPAEISPTTYAKHPSQLPPQRSPPPARRQNPHAGGERLYLREGEHDSLKPVGLRLGNRNPATKSEPLIEEEDEDETPRRRRSSWAMRLGSLSIKPDSPNKSLEALVEEGASPVFAPKDFGKLKKGKSA